MNGPTMSRDEMSRDRAEAERRLAAWMTDVAPGRAPETAIEESIAKAVTRRQAPGWLPKVGPTGTRREGPPGRMLVALTAVGLLAAAAGLVALGGGRLARPDTRAPAPSLPAIVANPTPSTAPTPRDDEPVEQALATGYWIGATRDIPAIGNGPFRPVFDLVGSVFQLFHSSGTSILDASATTPGPGQLRLVSFADEAGCHAGDVGVYRYSVAANGRQLTILPGTDACAARAALLPGSWDGSRCRRQGYICLGTLEAGTHATTLFRSRTKAAGPSASWNPAVPSVSFTVPDGWTNGWDSLQEYDLETTSFFEANFGAADYGPDAHGIYLKANPAASTQHDACTREVPQPGVGTSVDALVRWLTTHPGLNASAPQPLVIDGRPAVMVDLAIDPTWTKQTHCGGDPAVPAVKLFVPAGGSSDQYIWHLFSSGLMRVILIDLGGGDVLAAIVDSTDPATFDQLVADAMPIVESFRFAR